MTDEEIKQGFINAFGEEQYKIQEALNFSDILSEELAIYLNVPPLIAVVEPIPEEARLYLKEEFIILRKDIALDDEECAKAMIHEYRHFYQYQCIKNNSTNEPLLKFYKEDFDKINITDKYQEKEDYYSLVIELDAFAFTKYYFKEFFDRDINFPNPIYDKLIDEFIIKYYQKS